MWRLLAEQPWAVSELMNKLHLWNGVVQEERLGDLSFMRVLTKSQDEVPKAEFVYCFVDLEGEEDLFSSAVQVRKHYQRIRSFSKILRALPPARLPEALSSLPGPFSPLLAVLTGSVDLLQETQRAIDSPSPLQARTRALAACLFLKRCHAGLTELPCKVAPILQALVTAIRVSNIQFESVEWLLRKESKAAARAVWMLQGKPAAPKLAHNLLSEKPGAFLAAMEQVAGPEFLTRVQYFKDLLAGDQVSEKDFPLLRLLVGYLSPVAVKTIRRKLDQVLLCLGREPSEACEKCAAGFVEKLGSEGIVAFTRHIANQLAGETVSRGGQATLRVLLST